MGQQHRRPIAYEAYEKLADAYMEQVDTKPHNAYLERPALRSLVSGIRGRYVLDAGCGPGSNAEWLVGHGAHVIALDVSPKMIQHARRRLGDSVELKLHDLQEPLLFLPDESVDVVLALVMDYIEDWGPVFKELKRVLKKRGVLVFSVNHPFTEYIFKEGSGYFRVERVERMSAGFGVPVLMPSCRRPLEYITEALQATGFSMDRMIEAYPTEEYRKADPLGYRDLSRRPSFLCVRAIANESG